MFLISYNVKKFLLFFVPIFVSTILIFNAFSHNGGLPKLFILNSKIKLLEKELIILTKDVNFLEHKVKLISVKPIDKDLLEELAHNNGLSYSTDYFIPFNKVLE